MGTAPSASLPESDATAPVPVEAFDREPPMDDFLRNCVLNRPVALSSWWVPVELRCLDRHMLTETALQPWGHVATSVKALTADHRAAYPKELVPFDGGRRRYSLRSLLDVRRFVKCFPRAVAVPLGDALVMSESERETIIDVIRSGLKWLRQVTGATGYGWPEAIELQRPQWLRAANGIGARSVMRNPSAFAALQVLDVSGYLGFTDVVLAALPPQLLELDAGEGTGLTAEASFSHLRQLRALMVSDSQIDDAVVATVPPTVVRLDISGCEGLTDELRLHHLPALRDLVCAGVGFGAATLRSAPSALRRLECQSCQGLAAAMDWADTFPHLQFLQFSCDDAAGMASINRTPSTIRELELYDMGELGDDEIAEAATDIDLSHLRHLRA